MAMAIPPWAVLGVTQGICRPNSLRQIRWNSLFWDLSGTWLKWLETPNRDGFSFWNGRFWGFLLYQTYGYVWKLYTVYPQIAMAIQCGTWCSVPVPKHAGFRQTHLDLPMTSESSLIPSLAVCIYFLYDFLEHCEPNLMQTMHLVFLKFEDDWLPSSNGRS